MLIVMRADATNEQIEDVAKYVTDRGFTVDVFRIEQQSMIGVLEDVTPLRRMPIDTLPGVERMVPITHPFKLASRTFKPLDTVIKADGLEIGGNKVILIGTTKLTGNSHRLSQMARVLKGGGVSALKVNADVPSDRGFTKSELETLTQLARETGLGIIAEVISPEQVDLAERYIDLFLVGTYNMHNTALIQRVGKAKKPVILERGMSATIDEWLLAAHSIMTEGNSNVVLCERGIRTFEARDTLDVNAIPVVKKLSHLPIVIDSSQAAGSRDSVNAASKAAVAAGADGLIVSVYDPSETGPKEQQELSLEELTNLVEVLRRVAKAVDREL